MQLVFDGHNDVLLRLMRRGGANPERAFLDGENVGHLDWPRMRAGGCFPLAPALETASASRLDSTLATALSSDESMPPLRNAPSGTSATMRLLTASRR